MCRRRYDHFIFLSFYRVRIKWTAPKIFWGHFFMLDACYSLLESVKNILHSFNSFCVGGPNWKLVSDWPRSTNGCYVIWSDDSVFSEQKTWFRPNHHSDFSPMSRTKMTQYTKMSHLLISTNQRRAFNRGYLRKKMLKLCNTFFHWFE